MLAGVSNGERRWRRRRDAVGQARLRAVRARLRHVDRRCDPTRAQWAELAALSLEPPTSEDLRVIDERHLDHGIEQGVIGVGCRCKHGVPQAFAWDPFRQHSKRAGNRAATQPLQSGLFRLSCPMPAQCLSSL